MRRVRRPAAHTLYKTYVGPLSPAIGRSRRVLRLLQWMCPPTAPIQPRGTKEHFASSTDYQSLTCSAGVYPPRKTPYIPRSRGINPRATEPDANCSKTYGSDGSIADEFGDCQYILKPGARHPPAVRGAQARRGTSDCGLRISDCGMQNSERGMVPMRSAECGMRNERRKATRLRPSGYAGASGNGFTARSFAALRKTRHAAGREYHRRRAADG